MDSSCHATNALLVLFITSCCKLVYATTKKPPKPANSNSFLLWLFSAIKGPRARHSELLAEEV